MSASSLICPQLLTPFPSQDGRGLWKGGGGVAPRGLGPRAEGSNSRGWPWPWQPQAAWPPPRPSVTQGCSGPEAPGGVAAPKEALGLGGVCPVRGSSASPSPPPHSPFLLCLPPSPCRVAVSSERGLWVPSAAADTPCGPGQATLPALPPATLSWWAALRQWDRPAEGWG